MFNEVLIFSKISLFFIGFTLFVAYVLHRIAYLVNLKSLNRLFPIAFEACFQIVTSFYDVIKPSSNFEAHRFLTQIASRHNLKIPKQFKDLPAEIVREVYHLLQQKQNDFVADPSRVVASIRETIYQIYLQAYRHRMINESLDWLLIFIPFACITGILLPLILYLRFRFIVIVWPLALTFAGLTLGSIALFFILKDYLFKR